MGSSRIVESIAAGCLALAALVLPAEAKISGTPGKFETVCREQTARIERQEKLPGQLLSAIALAESGRWQEQRGETLAWPWTVYAQGRGRYFASKAHAVAAVRELRAKGVRSIDVGCMQVNLMHHRDAFASLDVAFDPAANVAYAARFVRDLHREVRSWSRAIAFYHSRTRAKYVPYRRKVHRLWYEERRRVAKVMRERRQAKYRRHRAEHLAARARQKQARAMARN